MQLIRILVFVAYLYPNIISCPLNCITSIKTFICLLLISNVNFIKLIISYIILLLNPYILYNISSCYTFVSRNQVIIAAKLVLINAYLIALVLISVYVFIFSLLLLIIYKKVKEFPLSNWLKSTLHKLILYNLRVKTSFKGYYFPTSMPQVLGLPSTS